MSAPLQTAQGTFALQRLPFRRNELLQAWDAADEYLLSVCAESDHLVDTARLLIINDSFGALAVSLAKYKPIAWSDSYLSQQATRLNLQRNGLQDDAVTLLDSTRTPEGHFDVVLIKAPKSLAFFEDLLIRIQPTLTLNTQIIVAGMLKNLPVSIWSLLERIIGPTQSSLAKKKARLIFCQRDSNIPAIKNPYPSAYQLENSDWIITNHANVFSREQLDIGTRFFIAHLPVNTHAQRIVDLGCGNGIVGLVAAQKQPNAAVYFVDESYMAVASAQKNFNEAYGSSREAVFQVGDGLENFEPASMDLILCNPPFHQQQTIGDHLALRMFKQAHKTLLAGGELWIIGNRHLGYQNSLKKLFGNCVLVAENPKFLILKVIKK